MSYSIVSNLRAPSVNAPYSTTRKSNKNTSLLPLSQKGLKSDIYFSGPSHDSTGKAVDLMEKGETAGNALIIVLKNAEFEKALAETVLHGLEGAVPFLNLATKAPSFLSKTNELMTQSYRRGIKDALEYFIKHPSSFNLLKWKNAENNTNFLSSQVASQMYSDAFGPFRASSEYLLNRNAPGTIGQKDLENAIRVKNTAIAAMFLFNHNVILEADPHSRYLLSFRITPSGHGRAALYPTEKYFDLLTALKLLDMHKSSFNNGDKERYYHELAQIVFDQFLYDDQDVNKLLLLRAHIKATLPESSQRNLTGFNYKAQLKSYNAHKSMEGYEFNYIEAVNRQLKELLGHSEDYIKQNYKTMFAFHHANGVWPANGLDFEPFSLYMDSKYLKGSPSRKNESLAHKQRIIRGSGQLFKQKYNEPLKVYDEEWDEERLKDYVSKMPRIKNSVLLEIELDKDIQQKLLQEESSKNSASIPQEEASEIVSNYSNKKKSNNSWCNFFTKAVLIGAGVVATAAYASSKK